jgi:hypothetical protein
MRFGDQNGFRVKHQQKDTMTLPSPSVAQPPAPSHPSTFPPPLSPLPHSVSPSVAVQPPLSTSHTYSSHILHVPSDESFACPSHIPDEHVHVYLSSSPQHPLTQQPLLSVPPPLPMGLGRQPLALPASSEDSLPSPSSASLPTSVPSRGYFSCEFAPSNGKKASASTVTDKQKRDSIRTGGRGTATAEDWVKFCPHGTRVCPWRVNYRWAKETAMYKLTLPTDRASHLDHLFRPITTTVVRVYSSRDLTAEMWVCLKKWLTRGKTAKQVREVSISCTVSSHISLTSCTYSSHNFHTYSSYLSDIIYISLTCSFLTLTYLPHILYILLTCSLPTHAEWFASALYRISTTPGLTTAAPPPSSKTLCSPLDSRLG